MAAGARIQFYPIGLLPVNLLSRPMCYHRINVGKTAMETAISTKIGLVYLCHLAKLACASIRPDQVFESHAPANVNYLRRSKRFQS